MCGVFTKLLTIIKKTHKNMTRGFLRISQRTWTVGTQKEHLLLQQYETV
jgi:hypothetical protein